MRSSLVGPGGLGHARRRVETLPQRVEVEDRVIGRAGATPFMKRTARAVAKTLFTTREGPPPAARLDWLVAEMDDFIAQAGGQARLVHRLCLFVIAIVAPLLSVRFPPFDRLDPEDRHRCLERFEQNRLFGLAFFGVKALLCILYYEHPAVARAVGFDGLALIDEEADEVQAAAGADG